MIYKKNRGIVANIKWYKKLEERNFELKNEVCDLKQRLKSQEDKHYNDLNAVVKECAALNVTKHRLEKENVELKEKYLNQIAINLQLAKGINNEN